MVSFGIDFDSSKDRISILMASSSIGEKWKIIFHRFLYFDNTGMFAIFQGSINNWVGITDILIICQHLILPNFGVNTVFQKMC